MEIKDKALKISGSVLKKMVEKEQQMFQQFMNLMVKSNHIRTG